MRERKRKRDKHLLFQCQRIAWLEQGPESACGGSRGAEAFIRASLTDAIWRDYGRFTAFTGAGRGHPESGFIGK